MNLSNAQALSLKTSSHNIVMKMLSFAVFYENKRIEMGGRAAHKIEQSF